MNKEFKIINNEVNVLTDTKGNITRAVTNNIEQVLIAENNVEEIENEISNYSNKLTIYKNQSVFDWSSAIAVLLTFQAGFILSLVANLWAISTIQFLGSVIFFGHSFRNIKSNKKFIKSYEAIIKELEINLQTEKEKLNELNMDKTNDLLNVSQNKKTIQPSVEINILKRKLDIIHYYKMNKSKLIKAYKNGFLLYYGLKNTSPYYTSNDEQILLKELIENDLNQNEEIKVKQKTLKKG